MNESERLQEIRKAVAKRHAKAKAEGAVLSYDDVVKHIELDEWICAAATRISKWKKEQAALERKIVAGISAQCSPENLIPDNWEDPKKPICDFSHCVTTDDYRIEVVYGAVRTQDTLLMWCERNESKEDPPQVG